MRISDWSSDVCSSDLRKPAGSCGLLQALHVVQVVLAQLAGEDARMAVADRLAVELGHRQHEGGAGGEKGFPRRPGLRQDRKSTRLKLQSLMRISYAVFCLKKKTIQTTAPRDIHIQINTEHGYDLFVVYVFSFYYCCVS